MISTIEMIDLGSFEKVWYVAKGLCAVKEEKLLFGNVLGERRCMYVNT